MPAQTTPLGALRLTPFQVSEVGGLIDLARDEVYNGTEGWTVWGDLNAPWLVVYNAADAVTELLRRADWLEQEGALAGGSGASGARSLRGLAAKVQALPPASTTSPEQTPLEVLTEARLPSRAVVMEDGYPSSVQRSGEEAAQVALDALEAAGYRIVPREALRD